MSDTGLYGVFFDVTVAESSDVKHVESSKVERDEQDAEGETSEGNKRLLPAAQTRAAGEMGLEFPCPFLVSMAVSFSIEHERLCPLSFPQDKA